MTDAVLSARGLHKSWETGSWSERLVGRGRPLRALADVDLEIRRGECLALVGESGCGKTTLGRCLVRQLVPDGGSVVYRPSAGGENRLEDLVGGALRSARRRLQLVFQESSQALDPRLTVGKSLALALSTASSSARTDSARTDERIGELLRAVGLEEHHAPRLPHQLSGGQRQRVGIARALAVEPEVVVLDESVSALDARHREQVLDLLAGLRRRLDLSLVFIGHDLSVVRRVADRVAVLYLGRIVEIGPVEALFEHPRHPYTAALLDAAPRLDLDDTAPVAAGDGVENGDESGGEKGDEDGAPRRPRLRGEVPSAVDPPSGCAFHPRCPRAEDLCAARRPLLEPPEDDRRERPAACHFPLDR